MLKKILAILFVVWLSVFAVNAQIKRISGMVTASDTDLPVPGVSVVVKGTTLGTVTNQDGYYQLSLPDEAQVLVFSFIGMKMLERPVSGSTLNVVMEPDYIGLEEVVVVAYGTSLKRHFTGAVSTVSSEQLERFQAADFSKALQGLASGVLSTSGAGQPGESAEIRIQGFNTFIDASPLIVVDGFSYDGNLSALPLSDIESVSILKDASATALFGSRAANGVIILTTKTGTKQEAQLRLNVKYGFSGRAIPDYRRVSAPDYYELQWEGIRNALIEEGHTAADASNMATQQLIPTLGGYNAYDVPNDEVVGNDGKINPGAQLLWSDKWQEELFVTGVRKEITLSSRGGSEKTSWYVSGAFLDDDGIIKASNLKRYSARVNVKTSFKDWIGAGLNLSGSLSEQNFPVSSGTSYLNPFHLTGLIAPVYPVYLYDNEGILQTDAEGNKMFDYGTDYGRSRLYAPGINPLGTAILDERLYKKDVFTIRSFLDFRLTEGLLFKTSVSADHYTFTGLTHQNMRYGDGRNFNGRTSRETNRTFSYTANQMFYYDKTFNGHSFHALAGHENYNYKFNVLSATRSGFSFPGLVELDGAAVAEGSGSYEDNYRLESYLAKIDYSFQEKYFASFNLRTDGNSRFAKEARWGNFWGAGLAWIVSGEEAFRKYAWLNSLRLKMSYGEQGNDKIGSFYGYQGLYQTGINNIDYPGILANRLSTPGLTWESLNAANLGFDFKLWNRFSLSFDYFIRKNSDLLFEKPLPPSTGFTSVDTNIAKLSNTGFDLELSGLLLKTEKLNWHSDINLGHLKNKILELPQDYIISGNKRWEEGRSVYEFWVEDFAGVNPENGKSQWFYNIPETDGNGNPVFDSEGNPAHLAERGITGDYTLADRYYAGSSVPDLYGGVLNSFDFYGFDFSFLINFGIGGKVMDQPYQWLMHSGQYGVDFHRDILNRWTPVSQDSNIPAVDGDSFANRRSTRFLADASWVNFRNVSIGYQFPKGWVERFNLQTFRATINADNLMLLSARKGLDPRQSFDGNVGRQYIPVRTISVGFDVQF